MVQYGKGRIVYKAARTRSDKKKLHTTPYCSRLIPVDDEDILEKPLPSFSDEYPKCTECFTMSDNSDDKAKAATHTERAEKELEAAAEELSNAGQVKHLEEMAEEAKKTKEVLEDQAKTLEE